MTMTSIAARRWLLKKVGRDLKKEIEQAGLENLKTLAENNISIVGTYFNGSPPQRKTEIRQQLKFVLSCGITPDMIIDEMAKQIPELGPIISGKEAYRKAELTKINQFLNST